MRFWAGWALWQKLSVVLAFLIAIVLTYSFGVLIHNKRKAKRHAEAEEGDKADQESELIPIMKYSSEIPFGARALERGIRVEGIWVSNNSTPVPSPHKPRTPAVDLPAFPNKDQPLEQAPKNITSNDQKPNSTDPPMTPSNSPEPLPSPLSKNDNSSGSNRPEPPRYSLSRVDKYPHLVAPERNELHLTDEPDMHPAKKPVRSSWITRSAVAYKRSPVIEGTSRRRSSEEFRRRMSRLFDENVQTLSTESFQLSPFHSVSTNDQRKSNLGSPPPL